MKLSLLLPLCGILACALTSCKESKTTGGDTGGSAGPDLSSFLLDASPDGAVSITEARQDPAPGTEIVIAGKVMGRKEPFVDGRALVLLGDPTKITSCDLIPGDDCPKPWDVCCDDPDVIATSIATVQIVDSDGRPLAKGLKGLGGMKELSSLVVKGTVAEGSNPNNLLVNATGIHIAMVEPTTENPAKENGGADEPTE